MLYFTKHCCNYCVKFGSLPLALMLNLFVFLNSIVNNDCHIDFELIYIFLFKYFRGNSCLGNISIII